MLLGLLGNIGLLNHRICRCFRILILPCPPDYLDEKVFRALRSATLSLQAFEESSHEYIVFTEYFVFMG